MAEFFFQSRQCGLELFVSFVQTRIDPSLFVAHRFEVVLLGEKDRVLALDLELQTVVVDQRTGVLLGCHPEELETRVEVGERAGVHKSVEDLGRSRLVESPRLVLGNLLDFGDLRLGGIDPSLRGAYLGFDSLDVGVQRGETLSQFDHLCVE
jgi:hypothetical protein